jgi:acetylornithine deacetylase
MTLDVFELTRQLIAIESPTGEEDKVMNFLYHYLERSGLELQKQWVDHTRFNILATRGEPRVILTTHTDTVRPYFPLSEDEDYLFGRGACDTRGIIAAQIKAAEILINERVTDFGLLFVVVEEERSDGAMAANELPNKCNWLINGEPTENRMALGTKGVMRVKLTTKGKACHSAYPELGESAIDKLLDILQDIRQIQWPNDKRLGNTTCNIGVIKGGVQSNVVAPEAEAHLMLRLVTSVAETKVLLSDIVAGRGVLDFNFQYGPVVTHVLEGFDTMIASFGTDIPFFYNWGTPILFGPGSILDAHTAHEKISKIQLQDSVGYYKEMVQKLLEE